MQCADAGRLRKRIILVHLAAQAILRQHALDRPFDHRIGAAIEKALGGFFFLATGVTGEVDIDLVVPACFR